jgi:hypothetical protein
MSRIPSLGSPRRASASAFRLLTAAGLLSAGCTSLLGIDGDYVEASSSGPHHPGAGGATPGGDAAADATSPGAGGLGAGGTSSGGNGGAAETGGSVSGGGTGGSGLCQSVSDCSAGEKCCTPPGSGGSASDKICSPPIAIVGCNASSCMPCPAPQSDGVPTCVNGGCAIQCNPGFHLFRGNCVPVSGGTGGSNGAGGSGSKCDPKTCSSSCGLAGPLPCCTSNGTCGCTWAPGAVCY